MREFVVTFAAMIFFACVAAALFAVSSRLNEIPEQFGVADFAVSVTMVFLSTLGGMSSCLSLAAFARVVRLEASKFFVIDVIVNTKDCERRYRAMTPGNPI